MSNSENEQPTAKDDKDARNRLSTSWLDHPYSQRPNADIDLDNPEVQRSLHIGDSRLGIGHSDSTVNMRSQAAIAIEDKSLWPEKLKEVSLRYMAGRGNYEKPEDDSLSISEKVVTFDEVNAVLNSLVKGFSNLRSKRQQEIAGQFSENEIAQIKADMYTNRAAGIIPEIVLDLEKFRTIESIYPKSS